MNNILDSEHWTNEEYKQRITRNKWRILLLNNRNEIIFYDIIRCLIGKNLGVGIIEISKVPIKEE